LDPKVALCLGPYGGPRGGAIPHERGTPVAFLCGRAVKSPRKAHSFSTAETLIFFCKRNGSWTAWYKLLDAPVVTLDVTVCGDRSACGLVWQGRRKTIRSVLKFAPGIGHERVYRAPKYRKNSGVSALLLWPGHTQGAS